MNYMRIGIQSGMYFGFQNYEAGLARAKEHGFDAVDLGWLCNTENALFQADAIGFEKMLTDLRIAAAQAGVELWQSHGPWRYPPKDETEADRAERYEKMSRALYGCAVADCPHLVIHPLMPYGDKKDPDPARYYEINFEHYSRLAEEAEKLGVYLCIENMPMPYLSLARSWDLLNFVKAVGNPFFRMCLDTGHAALFGQPATDARILGKEYLRVMHVHDNDGTRDQHLLPFTGVVDWTAYAAALREIGYDGVFMLETGVKGKFPPEILDHERRGVAMMARYIADMVDH